MHSLKSSSPLLYPPPCFVGVYMCARGLGMFCWLVLCRFSCPGFVLHRFLAITQYQLARVQTLLLVMLYYLTCQGHLTGSFWRKHTQVVLLRQKLEFYCRPILMYSLCILLCAQCPLTLGPLLI